MAVFAALSQSRPHTLPKDAETRTLFCSNCLTIVGVINEIVFEDVYRTKQVCDDLCYDLFGHTPSSGIACKQWLDSDLEKVC
ncbi:hypothetical protein PRIPAC_97216 [Pristionchus pacificus]|uniref:Uncharacterized protein n=1 Tax=Pristionchus pacificus TaxID=54126 RepID=A0A2A6D276_PRIPA|nr:hypothetical protein PRIPAC_97216 [Pristionchus pacificus]|eukprot:PDM84383.1 hypothetical protein PRIPAC_33406 [Pristionchus pacificus]